MEYDGDYKLYYPDGRVLIIEKSKDSETRIISGSKINNERFIINYKNNIFDTTNMQIKDFNTNLEVSYNQFIKMVNNTSNVLSQAMMKPCNQYPSDTTLSDCFQSEWAEFCDGAIGCMAQIFASREVAIAIAIHCTACVGSGPKNPSLQDSK
ncbi:MAG: hypothetical protein ACK5IC_05400 [Moheibacter sp.]